MRSEESSGRVGNHAMRLKIAGVPLLFAAVALLALGGCGDGDIYGPGQVMARVGKREITTTYFERQLANLAGSGQKLSGQAEGRRAFLHTLIDRELLYAEARKSNLDRDVELARRLDDIKRAMVIESFLKSRIVPGIIVDDREVRRYYDANPGEYRTREEVRISQIVVPDEDGARRIVEKLGIGREFGDLAASRSIDRESAVRQGDVGWFTRSRLPAEIRDGVFRLRTGEVSRPYRMPDGYEIYRITDRRTVSYPFEKVRESIRARLFNEKLQKEVRVLVDGLKKTTRIQVNEALLK